MAAALHFQKGAFVMKKKWLKIAAFILALALIVGIGWFANALVGNPLSKLLAKNAAERHLEENYADTDFYIDSVNFSFKDTRYYAHIKSPSSIDSHFPLYIDMLGRIEHDFYQNDVLDGWNTAQRIGMDYRELVDTVLDNPSFPYVCDIGYGDIEFIPKEYADNPDVPQYAFYIEDLEVDGIYDLREVGAQAGKLVLYIADDTITVERAAEIMLDIKNIIDDAGIAFYAMDFALRHPKTEEGYNWDESIDINDFLYADIYEDGFVERVAAANDATQQYYAEQDAEKAELIANQE